MTADIKRIINLIESYDTGVILGSKSRNAIYHRQWNRKIMPALLKDFTETAKHNDDPLPFVVVTRRRLNVYVYAHYHVWDNSGIPVLKYFDRHDRGYNGSVSVKITIPAETAILVDDGRFYGHDAEVGFYCGYLCHIEDTLRQDDLLPDEDN